MGISVNTVNVVLTKQKDVIGDEVEIRKIVDHIENENITEIGNFVEEIGNVMFPLLRRVDEIRVFKITVFVYSFYHLINI